MPGQRVLVVDDDPALRKLLALICRHAGCEVDLATNGSDALDAIATRRHAVVILDLQMPLLNGFDVIEALAKIPRRPAIVVVTALPMSALRNLDANVVQAIIRKPFDVELLTAVVEEFVAAMRADWLDEAEANQHGIDALN